MNQTATTYSISKAEDFIHEFYEKNDYITRMYISNPKIGTKYRHYKASEFCGGTYTENENVYMSMNPMRFIMENGNWTIKRDKEHVAALKWLYIDLDTYNTGLTNAQVLVCLQEEHFGQTIPHPTLVVDSGRGMYLLWRIEESVLAYNRWVKVQRYLHETLSYLGSDGAVVSDSARVLRCIGSVNSKNGKKVRVIDARNYKYTLYEIMTEYDVQQQPKKKFEAVTDNVIAYNGYHRQLKDRLNDLEKLLIKYRDFPGAGREKILFLYRYWNCCITGNAEAALKDTLKLNNRLNNPLSEKEVIRATRSAEKGCHGAKYRFKSSTVVEFLNITPVEMQDMKCFSSAAVKAEKKRKRAKEDYKRKLYVKGEKTKKQKLADRVKAVRLFVMQGMSKEKICFKLNISPATYYRCLEKIKTALMRERRASMRDKIARAKVTGIKNTVNFARKSSFSFFLSCIIRYLIPYTAFDMYKRCVRCRFNVSVCRSLARGSSCSALVSGASG
ncbi:MAG: hypothetical protein J6J86_09665 [Lachnospiraceae bacterium]|nr:hypothetical protein [Lachnospiraceae bacterium]